MEIKDLKANPDNPRKITDKKLKALEKALLEFGDLGGIVFNWRTGHIVGGHQRVTIFDKGELILDEINDPSPDRSKGYILYAGHKFSFREVDWDEAKEKAANIAANKGAGEWEYGKLTNWFKELDAFEFDLDLTMFDEDERKELLKEPTVFEEGLTDPDSIPEEVDTRCKLGDLWLLGNHRLLCGDSTDVLQVEKLMGGEKADMVHTDPPYGIAYEGHYSTDGGSRVDRDNLNVNNFDVIKGDFDGMNMAEVLAPFHDVKEIFVWGAQNFAACLPKSTWICWDRKLTESADRAFSGDFDLCWSKSKHKMKMYRHTWHGVFGHSKIDDGHKKTHPTMKPVALIISLFEDYAKENGLIVDLFLGSGSTLIACEKTKRECYGMEIDPKYCDVILSRWEKYTGQIATLATGE